MNQNLHRASTLNVKYHKNNAPLVYILKNVFMQYKDQLPFTLNLNGYEGAIYDQQGRPLPLLSADIGGRVLKDEAVFMYMIEQLRGGQQQYDQLQGSFGGQQQLQGNHQQHHTQQQVVQQQQPSLTFDNMPKHPVDILAMNDSQYNGHSNNFGNEQATVRQEYESMTRQPNQQHVQDPNTIYSHLLQRPDAQHDSVATSNRFSTPTSQGVA